MVYRRIIFICAGAATLIICVILLLKTPALNFEESGEELCAATEASRATTAADAQAAAAQALAARLESAPTTKFSRVLAAATDPAGVDATCAICLVDMESADFVKRLPSCRHWYTKPLMHVLSFKGMYFVNFIDRTYRSYFIRARVSQFLMLC